MQTDLLGVEPMQKTAIISECGLYRYELRRVWNPALRLLPVCMLNPSTADADKNDPTVLRLIHFAKAWGYGGIIIVNLFAFRSSSPKEMFAAFDPEGPENERYHAAAWAYARHANVPMLAAWGIHPPREISKSTRFMGKSKRHMVDLVVFGTTKDGFPIHPMARGRNRIADDQQPVMWRRAAEVA